MKWRLVARLPEAEPKHNLDLFELSTLRRVVFLGHSDGLGKCSTALHPTVYSGDFERKRMEPLAVPGSL